MGEVRIGNSTIEYSIVRTSRKTIGIVIDPDEGVIIRSPKRISEEAISELVKKKADWILEKLERVNEIKPAPRPKEYLSGEKLPYLGRRYRLKVVDHEHESGVSVKLINGKFIIQVNPDLQGKERRSKIRQELIHWYRLHCDSKLRERIEIYKDKLGVRPNNVQVKKQEKRWGSCSSKGNLNFNWRLIMAPMSVVDYIVVHELTHLIYPNHSKEFWSLVKTIIPDHDEKREWLRVNGKTLDF